MRKTIFMTLFLFVNTFLFSQSERLNKVENIIKEITFGLPISPLRTQVAMLNVNSDFFVAIPDYGVKNNIMYSLQYDKSKPIFDRLAAATVSFDFDENTGKAIKCELWYTFSEFDNSYLELAYDNFVNRLKNNSYSNKIEEQSFSVLHNPIYFLSYKLMIPRNKKPSLKTCYARAYCMQNNSANRNYNVIHIEIFYNNIK